MNRIADRAWIVLLLAFALVAGMAFFVCEYAAEARDWALFDGSPHVYSSGKLSSGTLTDREGTVLLDLDGGKTYASSSVVRQAVLHWTGDRQGYIAAPLLSSYANEMTGYDLLNGLYDYGDTAGTMELTLSAKVQTAALEAMGDYKGTVAVYNYKTGEILCAVSTPTYDPNDVPDIAGDETGAYEGVYLNRFLQATYTPGSIFKIVTAAAALETVPDILEQKFTCTGELEVGGGKVTCEGIHGEQTLKQALANSCNCAFAQITQLVGADKLQRYAESYGITSSLSFDGYTTASGSFDAANASLYELCWSGIGQHTDLINPCRYMAFMGAVASGGTGAQPYVVKSVRVGDTVTYEAETVQMDRIMSRSTAETLQELMRNNVEVKYGAEKFPDILVCAKSGTAEKDNDEISNAMFAGFVMDEEYPLAFIVVVQDGGYGSRTCIPIISAVLDVCMEVLDAE